MASEKILQQKQQLVAELAEKFKTAASGVLVDYCGLTVAEDRYWEYVQKKQGYP